MVPFKQLPNGALFEIDGHRCVKVGTRSYTRLADRGGKHRAKYAVPSINTLVQRVKYSFS